MLLQYSAFLLDEETEVHTVFRDVLKGPHNENSPQIKSKIKTTFRYQNPPDIYLHLGTLFMSLLPLSYILFPEPGLTGFSSSEHLSEQFSRKIQMSFLC